MIVDASVIVAIIKPEDDGQVFRDILATASAPIYVSAAGFLEAAIVIDSRKSPERSLQIGKLLLDYDIEIAPVTETQAHIARQAYQTYGKGSGHKAQLNFGDCFAYALAKDSGKPLLFKGSDFAHTDVTRALP